MKQFIICLFFMVFAFGKVVAQVPHTMSYQGYYTSNNGQPVTGAYPMTFKLYTQSSGGSPIWTQTFQSVQITKGVYSVVLSVDGIEFNRQYWLETVINGVTSANRTQLTGVPYSLGPWMPTDTNVVFNGGNVGIGTIPQYFKLEVAGDVLIRDNLGVNSVEISPYGELNVDATCPQCLPILGGRFKVAANGNVGVGTNNPQAKLDVRGNVGVSVTQGNNPAIVASGYDGIWALARDNGNGSGVRGYGAGSGPGVVGITYSTIDNAAGVRGEAAASGGQTIGVEGVSTNSPIGTGVVGRGSATGGYFEAFNPDGYAGVFAGKVSVNVLQINGGSDLAEPFSLEEIDEVEPGTLLVIDKKNPGSLRVSTVEYDHTVAGIVSGAGDIRAGITLGQNGVIHGNTLVAIAGRVYCKAEALSSPIEPGDLLTTSNIPGHAMKATDKERSQGAIIGKAMSSLASGKGLVLVLVNLQ